MAGTVLDREEYVEQEYLFRVYRERLEQNIPSQEILQTIQEEILATTRLPLAIDFMRAEIMHLGRISGAMVRLAHYFAPFQAFVMQQAEADESRFDQITALRILEREANFRSRGGVPAGLFIYQFECIARNRLGYYDGLEAISRDPFYDAAWSRWIRDLRVHLGARDLAEVVYLASLHYQQRRVTQTAADSAATVSGAVVGSTDAPGRTALFGDQEGRIARANIRRDPLYFFAALQRQLGYPAVPRLSRADDADKLSPRLESRLAKIEQRIKLLEMEQRGGIDLARLARRPDGSDPSAVPFTDDVPDFS